MTTRRSLLAVSALLLAVALVPARGHTEECEGRCADESGSVMVVSAGECDPASEECRAGCDASGPDGPRPYAECVSRITGEVVQRRTVVVPTDARRE